MSAAEIIDEPLPPVVIELEVEDWLAMVTGGNDLRAPDADDEAHANTGLLIKVTAARSIAAVDVERQAVR